MYIYTVSGKETQGRADPRPAACSVTEGEYLEVQIAGGALPAHHVAHALVQQLAAQGRDPADRAGPDVGLVLAHDREAMRVPVVVDHLDGGAEADAIPLLGRGIDGDRGLRPLLEMAQLGAQRAQLPLRLEVLRAIERGDALPEGVDTRDEARVAVLRDVVGMLALRALGQIGPDLFHVGFTYECTAHDGTCLWFTGFPSSILGRRCLPGVPAISAGGAATVPPGRPTPRGRPCAASAPRGAR